MVSFAAYSSKVSINISVLISAVVFLYCFLSLWSVVLCLSGFPFLDYLTSSCVHFPNYFKEGEETFCSLNVFFS